MINARPFARPAQQTNTFTEQPTQSFEVGAPFPVVLDVVDIVALMGAFEREDAMAEDDLACQETRPRDGCRASTWSASTRRCSANVMKCTDSPSRYVQWRVDQQKVQVRGGHGSVDVQVLSSAT